MNEEGDLPGEEHPGHDLEVKHMKEQAVEMGQWALGMVHDGWMAFERGDLALAQAVIDRDGRLDRYDQDVEREAVGFLVKVQPMGRDLREATAVLKAITYLDRIGRYGFDIAWLTSPEGAYDKDELRELLRSMDALAEEMVAKSLEALANDRADLARSVFDEDDRVDEMNRSVYRIVMQELRADPSLTQRIANELLVARHFERIADHACKIAEKTIYAVTGQRRGEYLPKRPPPSVGGDSRGTP
ncbi:MAG: phosphate signaling complex protein PhoU [Thermoplasmata archaeon]